MNDGYAKNVVHFRDRLVTICKTRIDLAWPPMNEGPDMPSAL